MKISYVRAKKKSAMKPNPRSIYIDGIDFHWIAMYASIARQNANRVHVFLDD